MSVLKQDVLWWWWWWYSDVAVFALQPFWKEKTIHDWKILQGYLAISSPSQVRLLVAKEES